MKILLVNWTRRLAGGAEVYLGDLVPLLAAAGHEVAMLYEAAGPVDRAPVVLPPGSPAWCADQLGATGALERARRWSPDVLYVHGLLDPAFEARVQELGPAVFLAHGYYGTCISGAKTFRQPTLRPCTRRFGWRCAALYYPRRTGGLSPVTMLREYRRQAARLELLERYRSVVTISEHMRREFLRHGLAPERVRRITHYVRPPAPAGPAPSPTPNAPHQLLFVGRMTPLMGGRTLIDALPEVARALPRPLHLVLVGDGPSRVDWLRRAARVARPTALEIDFVGWLPPDRLDALYRRMDLLVLPSLWPEPFGQVGVEAAWRGVPSAAFDVGGITEWLERGVGGYVAPGNPPTARGLARAIVECLDDPAAHRRLREGAREGARRFGGEAHMRELMEILVACKEPRAERRGEIHVQ